MDMGTLADKLGKIYNELAELGEVARIDIGNSAVADLVDEARHCVFEAQDRILDQMELDQECDDSMDGDHESALTSAGMGLDESYNFFSDEY